MKIAILGYGLQGESAYGYWRSPENQITVCDQDTSLELSVDVEKKLGPDYLKDLDSFDLLVRAPSIHPSDIVAASSPDILQKVTTNTNEFFKVCPSRNIIGVTGTKGKGTTSTLIAKMLEAAGKRVHLGGNIGTPPLDLLKADIKPDDWVVLELANFQLIDIKYSPHIAVCLMVVPEHLDWHADIDEYIAAKRHLFTHQKSDDFAVYFAESENSQKIVEVSAGYKIPYFAKPGALVADGKIMIADQVICRTDELKLLGTHNWQNACAAVTAAWQIDQNTEAMRQVLTSFAGLEHRLEFVREVGGVKFYDDSFGTTPETAIVAIEAFSQPKVVILGGSDKGADYKQLAKTVKDNDVRSVVAIGKTGPAIVQTLRSAGYNSIVESGSTMPEIVATARGQSQTGDVVLLSTSCASFDLFKNYKDRGEQFKKAVQALV
jgi:UDP-N-acetylmuramoylalanine--D-glutamate ligase